MKSRLLVFAVLIFSALVAPGHAAIVISEIMYHPQSENPAEEFIELHNTGAGTVAVGGWQFTSGVAFTIPAGTNIAPGEFLVVAANGAAFSAKYPAVTGFVAGWTGQLSNSANTLTLKDALGVLIDEVTYADDGDWAVRVRQDPPDYGHRGWKWKSDADGYGKSLELINALYDNSTGQNWAVSTTAEGTPGAVNSVAAADLAPVISAVEHFPLVPASTDLVTVNARVADDAVGALTVEVHYRNDGAATFTSAAMFDDGTHDDALAGDGVFGVQLPARADLTVVEYYITATDLAAHTRTWPALSRDYTGALVQRNNCLYQVEDTAYAGAQPLYRVIMRADDRTELADINAIAGTPPFAFNPGETADQTQSHARFNATWVSVDGTGEKLRYLTGVRNRGNGSRTATPPNYNVQFPNADAWNGRTALNLNSQDTPWQLFGSALYRKAGLAAAESRAVQLRVNGASMTGLGSRTFGFYVCNEFFDSDFADRHFPLDSSGNLYRGQRFVTGTTAGGTTISGANLARIVPAVGETLSLVDLYKLNYRKETNTSEDNWSDLIALTTALAKGQSGATINDPTSYDGDYLSSVAGTADVAQWMRWFAVNSFADNEETNLSNGDGDDYAMYFGQTDTRCRLLGYDLDTILGRSGTSNVATHGIFRMVDAPDGSPTPVNPLMKHPAYAPLYYGEMKRLLDGAFAPAEFNAFCDQILGGIAPASVLTTMKSFNAARHAHITTLVPLAIAVTASQETGGTALTPLNGYPRTLNPACTLIGKAHAVNTRSVKVNGVTATWSAWQAQWTAASVALTPGVNRILIQAFDGSDVEIEHAYHSVWYDDASEAGFSGALASTQTWTAAGGPYRITASFTIPTGLTLTIQPGAVVYLNSGVNFSVASGGQLLAEGTETQPIRFMAGPGGANWGGIIINGAAGTPETRIAHAYIEGNGADGIDVNAGDVVLDHIEFGNPAVQYLSLDGASFLVSHCIFPTATAAFELVHGTLGIKAGGRGIMRDCFFGKTNGYNDSFDFTGGNRPGPILQFINNVCIGSDDDILDFDGADAWVEGNVFMHVHRIGSPDSASAVSGGEDQGNANAKSHITIVGNVFYDVDQAATAKQGNFYTFLNNTVVDQNSRGSDEIGDGFQPAVLNFDDDNAAGEALGMYVEGNIIHSAEALVRNYVAALSTVTFNNNLLNMPWTGPGSGNTVADALLNDPQILSPTQANFTSLLPVIRAQFGLEACSPARGTGPNGTDKGGIRPLGVSLGGAPTGTTSATSATLTVGTLMTGSGIPATAAAFPSGSGWTHYKSRIDGGAWSAETPIATAITLSGLANGVHTVEVVGKNDAGFFQDDVAFGANARITSASWTVDTGYVPPPATNGVRINEVLASNTETVNFGTAFPDIIELHNAGSAPVNVSGWGLTDTTALPFKYTIPALPDIAAGGFLVIYGSNSGSVPVPKTGFGLKAGGDTLTLTRSAAAGGGVADVVPFGNQLADSSIGRCVDGSWELCRPTFGSANVLANRGAVGGVVINEWLTAAVVLNPTDFIELYNPSTLPVNVGLGYLTDNPSDWPQRHQIRQLTFIAPGGYVSFKADSDPGQGPDHLNFKLDPLQGEIGLFDDSIALIDNVVYGPQSSDVSEGRTPNGTGLIATFSQPTPGGPNPTVVGTFGVSTVNLIPAAQAWKYRSNGTDHSAAFYPIAFNDSAWASGTQLLYIETAALTNSEGFLKTTALPPDTANPTPTRPYNTVYFRTHFTYSGPLTGVTLTAKIMCDDGALIYLNGVEATRVRMPAGTINYASIATGNVSDATVETINIPTTNLVVGDNVLAVEVHQEHALGVQTSSDITWGMKLDATVVVPSGNIPVVLNEVLPINATLQNPDTSYVGWIELHNTSASAFDASDMSLSDNTGAPRKFVFAPGTNIPAGGSIVVQCDPLLAASATNTGWVPGGDGGVVALYHTLANGGGLHDSVAYGRQIPDFSVGRSPDGTGPWALCVPTRAAQNTAAGLAALTGIRLNEWLAQPASGADFLELYNPGALPVALGGNYLTDQLTNKSKHLIPPLSFIAGSGAARWQAWIADNSGATPGHVNFTLDPGEGLGLYTPAGTALDTVAIGTPTTGQSGGRIPDGSSSLSSALLPTPAAANAFPVSDTDSDGIPDAWETANGLNPNDSLDAALDADGDGQSNRAEYLAGTNPQSGASRLAASLVPTLTPGEYAVRFTAVAGKAYTVRYKNALTDTTWTKLADVPAPVADTLYDVIDPAAGAQSKRFYQVVTPQVP